MAMEGEAEPGCLVSDLAGFASLHAAGLDAAQAMEKCCRLGLEPVAAGKGASDLDGLERLASEGKAEALASWPLENVSDASGAFSPAVPPKGIFANKDESAQWWEKRQALAYILGLDPVIVLMTPEITEEKLVELIQLSAEWEEFSLEDLQGIVSGLIEKSK